ncbi:MAG: protein kinase domain-containing protein [Gemmataceae bacterium]
MNEPSPPQPETIETAHPVPNPAEERPSGTKPSVEPSPPLGITVDFSDDDVATESSPPPGLTLPGYEVLGVLGRGGMGVVYKAREIALERLVALKVVTAGGHASAEQMARFRAEARAEARLQHPHIVQVHAIGEHESFPFLSLEYMDGGSLAQKLSRQPQPPRDAAQLVYLLARAMAYAHQRGIIHRDLKPANILLQKRTTTKDTNNTNQPTKEKRDTSPSARSLPSSSYDSCDSWLDSHPKIADFGLAKCLEDESGQTRTGSILGTPSYMSPEQADGRKDIGPATDIWALGILLYEMLVGRTPFAGITMMDTLEQVRTREPVPPTQLQPKVPRDLETICLKCLRKEPSHRYASAEALAEDLRRFLDGEPILARPIGSIGRLLHWSRRNPRVAGLSAAVLLLLLAVAVGSTVFAFVLEGRRRELQAAWQQARDQETLARQEGQRADDKAREATTRYQLLHEALVVVIDKVQKDLQAVPSTSRVRREILEAAMKVLQKSMEQSDDSSHLPQRSLAWTHVLMGYILREQKKNQQAIAHFNQAHVLLETLYRLDPNNDKAAGNYASSLSVQGDLALDFRNNAAEAEKLYRQALDLQETSLAHRPEHPELTETEIRRSIANSYQRLGEILLRSQPQRTEEARQHFEKARANLERVIPVEDSLGNHLRMEQVCYRLGELNERLERTAEALTAYRLCLEERKKLAASFPQDLHRQMELPRLYGKIGDLLLFSGDTEAARRSYSDAIDANKDLVRRNTTPGPRMLLSLNYYRLATAYLRLRRRDLAEDSYRKCLDLRDVLQREHPKNLGLKIDVMIAQGRCGLHRESAKMADQLRKNYPKNPTLLVHAACGYALSAFGVVGGKTEAALTAEERRLRQEYCRRAVEALRQAKANGYKDVKNLQIEPDLDAIRQDKSFQSLLREFAAPAPQ